MKNTVRRLAPTFEERVAAIEKDWASNPRWAHTTRHYSAKDVVMLQGSTVPFDNYSKSMSEKAFFKFKDLQSKGECSVTFGALDPTQIIQMCKWASSIYVSGWQCSSTASTSNEPGPDLADYPMDTVPNKVDQLVRAQRFHDKKQWAAQGGKQGPHDFLTPIIADADTGHGGLTAVMRLTKLFIDAGSAGMHIEDQKPGAKKCGHMGGKVMVAMQEEIDRLQAARLQSDISGASMLLVARTDAEAAQLIDSNMDVRDHPFINGINDKKELVTYGDHIRTVLAGQEDKLKIWNEKWNTISNKEAQALAQDLVGAGGKIPFWCWDEPRSRDGFYQFASGIDACIARQRAYAPYADLCWMETAKPGLVQATAFSKGLEGTNKILAYNLSPSFNWDKAGMSDDQIKSFCKDLGKLGFAFQFITLAGFHGSGLIADQLARSYIKDQDMSAYVNKIQRVEREQGVELLTHQTWSGAEYIDKLLETVRGTSDDIGIQSAGSTEAQFK